MMTNLALSALIALLHVVVPLVPEDRLKAVTEDMTAVVQEEITNGNLKSNIKPNEALAALVAAATTESGLRAEVENCATSGDGGKSIGLGQVMRGPNWEGHSKKEICSNRKLQLKLALHVIDRCWERTPRPDATFRCYTSGDASVDSAVAKREFNLYRRVKKEIDTPAAPPPGKGETTANLTGASQVKNRL